MRLKNGSDESSICVSLIMLALHVIIDNHRTAFYDAVMIARNKEGHNASEVNIAILVEYGLLDLDRDGRMHDTVRNVILSAASGEGTELRLGSLAGKVIGHAPLEPR